MSRTLLLLIIFVAIAANAQEKLGFNIRGASGKSPQVTSMFSISDIEAMKAAEKKILDDEVPVGTRADWRGDTNSGYFQIVSLGTRKDREYSECREIVKASARFSFVRILCMNNRAGKWELTDANLYNPQTMVENVPSNPPPANIATGVEVIR